jgi:hypothetical protein
MRTHWSRASVRKREDTPRSPPIHSRSGSRFKEELWSQKRANVFLFGLVTSGGGLLSLAVVHVFSALACLIARGGCVSQSRFYALRSPPARFLILDCGISADVDVDVDAEHGRDQDRGQARETGIGAVRTSTSAFWISMPPDTSNLHIREQLQDSSASRGFPR